MRFNATQRNSIRFNVIQCNSIRFNAYNDVQKRPIYGKASKISWAQVYLHWNSLFNRTGGVTIDARFILKR